MKKARLFMTVFLFVAVVALLAGIFTRSVIKAVYPLKYEEKILSASEENSLEPSILFAVIKTESSFDTDAESNAGAVGLMQILPETFEWLQTKTGESLPPSALTDVDTSIRYGAFFLGMLFEEFGETRTALAAYHAGRGRVNGWLDDPEISPDGQTLAEIPFPDTAHYVSKVERTADIYKKLYKIN